MPKKTISNPKTVKKAAKRTAAAPKRTPFMLALSPQDKAALDRLAKDAQQTRTAYLRNLIVTSYRNLK